MRIRYRRWRRCGLATPLVVLIGLGLNVAEVGARAEAGGSAITWRPAGAAKRTLAAPSAVVPSVDLVCLATFEFDFTPPLSFTTTSGTIRGLATSCGSPSGRYPRLKSAVVFASSPLVAAGCSPAPLTLRGQGSTIFWNDGSHSTFDTAISTDPTGGIPLGLRSVVTAGTLEGATITGAPAIVSQDGVCLVGGVRSLTVGLGAVTFTTSGAMRHVRVRGKRGATGGRRWSPLRPARSRRVTLRRAGAGH